MTRYCCHSLIAALLIAPLTCRLTHCLVLTVLCQVVFALLLRMLVGSVAYSSANDGATHHTGQRADIGATRATGDSTDS